MKLEFLGTRGNTSARTRRHWMHSSLMVHYYGARVLVDCGEDWLGQVGTLAPHAIVITHAHPDHAWGLRDGAPCPVHATGQAWEGMAGFAIEQRVTMPVRERVEIEGVTFEAFPVDHSVHAPAVGYRIGAGRVVVFYAPDVAQIHDPKAALRGVRLYVGDGASIDRPMVRKLHGLLVGHAPVGTQLTWCGEAGVGRAIFTHCGGEIMEGDERAVEARIRAKARVHGVEAQIACDGQEVILR